MKQFIGLAIAAFILFSACKKDNDKIQTLQEKNTAILISGEWNLTFRGEDYNEDGTFDTTAIEENYLADCEKDNTYTFAANDQYAVAPNANSSGCTDQVINGTWNLDADGTTLTMDGYTGAVDSLTPDYVRYRLDIDDYSTYWILTK